MALQRESIVNKYTPEDVCSHLFRMANVVKLAHLSVQGPGSYASHTALSDLYDALSDYGDKITETHQGSVAKILQLSIGATSTSPDILSLIRSSKDYINSSKSIFSEDIQNMIDELIAVYNKTIYKLTFLK